MSRLPFTDGAPLVVLAFLEGPLLPLSSAFRRALVVAPPEFRFPLALVLGRATWFSSDPVLAASLTPRAELPVMDALPFICGDVFTDAGAGAGAI